MTIRHLHLRGATGQVRTEQYNGREHLVVPVVALMEGVIHAVNAETPEFVPAATLQAAAHTWNGRPLMLGHPTRDGQQIPANDPVIMQRQGFGTIFQSKMSGSRLAMEAWIDPQKLEALGQQQLLERIRNGEQIEVSVGAFAKTDAVGGEFNGKKYKGSWLAVQGDHLAFLPNGRGACSIAMGCGAHRAASYHVTAEGLTMAKDKNPTLKERILALFDTPEQQASEEAAELIGYNLLRTHLDTAGKAWDEASKLVNDLIADEVENPTETPGQEDAEEEVEQARVEALMSLFGSIANAASQAMSTCMNLNAPDVNSPRYMAAIGKTISAKSMKSIQAAHDNAHSMHDSTTALGAECNGMKLLAGKTDCLMCDGSGSKDGNPCEGCDGTGELKTAEFKAACGCGGTDMTKEERVAALLKNDHNPMKDQKALMAAGDDALKALEAHCAQAATLKAASDKATSDKAIADKAAADLKAKEGEDLKAAQARADKAEADLKVASQNQVTDEMRALVEERKAKDALEHATLVTTLKAASTVLTEEQLKAKSLEDLRTIAAFAKISAPQDFSGRGLAATPGATTEDFTPPNPYAEGIKALQAQP